MDTRTVAKEIAGEAIVLLENKDALLPLKEGSKIAFLGRAQIETVYSGNGSGSTRTKESKNILEECERNHLFPVACLKEFYEKKVAGIVRTQEEEFDFTKCKQLVNSGMMYEIFGKYRKPEEEFEIPRELLKQAEEETDTAILTLRRNSGGEECDRHLEDYYLLASEKRLVESCCESFDKVILLVNVNGVLDLSWTKEYPQIKSILFIGIPGEEGAVAVAEILCGRRVPSGKLAMTIAERYEDYPSAEHFSWNKDNIDDILTYQDYGLDAGENGSNGFLISPVTVYKEGIYCGYRYFDSFAKEPLYPFGFGLSYTHFEIVPVKTVLEKGRIRVEATVQNIGEYPGKEVVEVYLSATDTKLPHARQELKGFAKTRLLKPKEEERVEIIISCRELAAYSEEMAAYVIETGNYIVRVGNSSRNTVPVAEILVEEDVVLEWLENRAGMRECNRGKISFLQQDKKKAAQKEKQENMKRKIPRLFLEAKDIKEILEEERKRRERVVEEEKEKKHLEEKAAALSEKELAALCTGYGPGVPFSAFLDVTLPNTIMDENGNPVTVNNHPVAYNGYVSPAIPQKGITSIGYLDGPAGIGEIAWPTEMLIACAFDPEIWKLFGDAVGAECEKRQIDVWLAPAVNLQRHPLCGRNFEYFSEDPFLTGVCACSVMEGVQKTHPVSVCPKHFAANEQETYRRGNEPKKIDACDSILEERVLRELYLKPFEMLVKSGSVYCMMTSFNKINGTFAGGNKALCTDILRGEWGYQGAVVSDWGDMDIVVDGADAVAAGNDIVMPGGPPVIEQILKGLEEGRVNREILEKAVAHLLALVEKTGRS